MHSVMVALPESIELCCPKCQARFSVAALSLHGRDDVYCVLCGQVIGVYDSMPAEMRRLIYHALRNSVEQRIFEQQQMEHEGYFEDAANLPAG